MTTMPADSPETGKTPSHDQGGLHGIKSSMPIHWNLSPAQLYTHALKRGEGNLTDLGAFAANTAPHTGRSPGDRYIVRDDSLTQTVDWGPVNVPLDPQFYDRLRADLVEHLADRELFVRDARAGDPSAGIGVRVVTSSAWHTLFAYNMFLRPPQPSWLV